MKDKLRKLSASLMNLGKDTASAKISIISLASESIKIDLWELESLVNSEKFEFPESEIGLIGFESGEDE